MSQKLFSYSKSFVEFNEPGKQRPAYTSPARCLEENKVEVSYHSTAAVLLKSFFEFLQVDETSLGDVQK